MVLTGSVVRGGASIDAPLMGRAPVVPRALSRGPFTLADARRHGLDRWNLQGASWRRLGPQTYALARLGETPQLKLEAAGRRLPPGAVFSGFTAAWLHGLDVEPCDPIEVTAPSPARISTRAGLVVRRRAMDRDEVVTRRGLAATSMLRTIRDLCPRLSLTEAVAITDMALHAGKVDRQDLVAAAAAPTAGVRVLRQVLEHAEPAAESPMETRLRMLLVLAGLPRPEAQVAVRDRLLRVIGRPDLYYRDERLGLEYDGGTHRDTLVEDNRRQNRLLDAGVRLLRFTAGDIFDTPDHVIGLVRAALAA
jgi:hypothetical protein